MVSLVGFSFGTTPVCLAAPRVAAKIENVHNVSDGQRKIRINGRRLIIRESTRAPALAEAADGDARTITDTNPKGTVAGGTPGMGEVQVIATEIHWGAGGAAVPVKLDSSLVPDPQPTDFSARFGGEELCAYDGGTSCPLSKSLESVNLGTSTTNLTFRANVSYDSNNADHDGNHWTGAEFHREILSDSVDSMVVIDGDNINDLITQRGVHPPYGNQLPISSVIQQYVDTDGNVYLDNNRILVLFELGTSNSNSPAWDFQDLVIAVDLEGIVGAPDYVYPNETATGSPVLPGNYPWRGFEWSKVRAAPGGSQIKGLAYQLHTETVAGDTIYDLKACIAATGTNPSWTNCTLRTVYSRTNSGLSNATGPSVDMAMNDNGFHGLGWLRYDGSIVRYLISFTKDNGQNWDATPHDIGHYTAGSSIAAEDIDMASNEAGSIGILVYYRQSGSPAPNPTELNSLVLYTYNMNVDPTLNNPVKTVIVAGDGGGVGALFKSQCNGSCFALTGDVNDTFHAFYYRNGAVNVTTVENANGSPFSPTTMFRTIPNSVAPTIGAASTCNASSPTAGGVVVVSDGTGAGVYDVPTSGTGTIAQRTSVPWSTWVDDMVYTKALVRAVENGDLSAILGSRLSASGSTSFSVISDSLPTVCPNPPYTEWRGPSCEIYGGGAASSVGAAVIGDTYYAASHRQHMVWGTNRYSADVQHIVIHQAPVEP